MMIDTQISQSDNLSLMNEKQRMIYLKKNWSVIVESVKDILTLNSKLDKEEIDNILDSQFSKKLILGQGMWGIVIRLNNDKIIAKITSDLLEISLIDVILKTRGLDDSLDLSRHKGIPHIAGMRLFNDLNGLFVREDLNISGVTLSSSNPISRSVDVIIKNYVTPLSTDEMVLSDLIHERKDVSLRDVAFAHSILKGNAIKYARKTISKMPKVGARSKAKNVVSFINSILFNHSIALIDLHAQNLAKPKHDIYDIFGVKRSDEDFDEYIISDLGLAYDTPIMAIDSPVFDNFTNLPALKRKKPLGVVLDRMISLYLSRDDTIINTIYNNKLTKSYMVKKGSQYIRSNPYSYDDSAKDYLVSKLSSMAKECIMQGIDFLKSPLFYSSVNILCKKIIEQFVFDVDEARLANSMLQEFIQSLCDRIEALSSLSGDDHTLVGVGFCALEDIKKCVSKDKRTIPIIIDNRLLMSIKEYDFNILKDIPDNFALTYFEINRNFHSFVELKDFMTHNLVDNKTMSIYIPITSIFSVNGL